MKKNTSVESIIVSCTYLPQNFGRWRRPMNNGFALKWMMGTILGGEDTQQLLAVSENVKHSQEVGIQKVWGEC